MAKPRIFISSTFYDLKQVRADLERMIKELGYEAVRNETGAVPYGKDKAPEAYAYKELELCDIIVTIIGGRYGSESSEEPGLSITQNELRRALEKGIQVFIFIDRDVLGEFSTYRLNKDNSKIKYKFVDNVKVYEFIEMLIALPRNNPIAPFSTSSDITEYLQAQWAGLFQRFLTEQHRVSEVKVLDEMQSVASTLQQLVTFLTKERRSKDDAIKTILLSNHPAFRRFAKVTGTFYRVYFSNKDELNIWLGARGWQPVSPEDWDEDSKGEWHSERTAKYLKLTHDIFASDGMLKVMTEDAWQDKWLEVEDMPPESDSDDDDLPF